MRKMLGLILCVLAMLVISAYGTSTFGPSPLPAKIPVAPIPVQWGASVAAAHSGGSNPDNNGDFHSGPDDGFGTHSGEQGNGGRGDCHCNGTNGNDKSTEGTSPK